jgi:threonine/homoserine/homoserine lactone efflux protein
MIFFRLLEVVSLGFLCGLIPGPVVSAVFAETLRNGWRASRRIVAWAAAGELVMSVACVALFSAFTPPPLAFSVLSGLGALILLHLAWDLWRVDSLPMVGPNSGPANPVLFTNRRVFTVAILNGMAWVFWLTVCVPQAVELGKQLRRAMALHRAIRARLDS